jgi:two-component system, cell cycle response regulator
MNEQLVEKIRQCPTLPSLPSIAIQVLELAQKDAADIAEIARIISKDPALSSKILRTVNSSFYGRSQSISTISHALVILGLQSVKTLVLGFSLVTNLARNKPRGFKHLDYWRRSIYAATAARSLASKFQIVQQEECFLAALLMDIGMLVMDQVLGEQYSEVHSKAQGHHQLAEFEMQSLGMTHADVTRLLAEQWKLPPLLTVPMANHHSPDAVADPSLRRVADLVYLASRCADVFVDEKAAEPIAIVRQYCQQHYQMPESECDAMLNEICTRTKEVAPLFEVSIASGTTYESILKKANEALVDLTLRTQQQAASLQQQNQKLQHQAATDALTGLANRASFDRFMAAQFAKAVEQNKPLAMLMIDVDKFKNVNDQYGHPAGDQVLRALGQVLKQSARANDLAVRYGGEEMVMVMPSTTRSTAAAIAESIRVKVFRKPMLACEGINVPVTVSIGVAAYEPGSPFKHAAHLIKAADLAVYAAKNSGRNNVKVFAIKAAA